MKVKRYKRVQKYLTFYKNNFGFRAPFQILIDATFCQSALQNKVNISEQMPKYLSESVKLVTTVCVVNETEKLSQSLYGAMVIIKQFPTHRCGHEKSPISANDCLKQLICGNNNDKHYMLATQDGDLTRAVRKKTVCPLIYMKGNTLVMEKPDESAKEIVRKEEEKSQELAAHEIQVIKKLKKKHDLEDSDTEKKAKRRRKGPKGPNPLSCKKRKKTSTVAQTQRSVPKAANKKKRSRVPKHIKRMFAKIEANISNQ